MISRNMMDIVVIYRMKKFKTKLKIKRNMSSDLEHQK
jgi:hypothetical protein